MWENFHDPEDTESADTEEGNDHGFDGVTETAERTADNVHDAAEEVSGEKNFQTEPSPLNDIWISVVNTEKLFAEKEDGSTDDNTCGNGAYDTVKNTADDAFVFFCAVVLPGETDRGVKERRHGDIDEPLKTLSSSIAGDGLPSEGVDGGLDGDI